MSVSVESRTDRLAELLARARARLAAGHQPRQRPLPDRLHRHQRRGRRAPRRRAAVLHGLPLRRAGRRAGARLRDGAGRRRHGRRPRRRGCTGAPASRTTTSPCARTASSPRSSPTGVELVAAGGLVEGLRAVKDAGEVAAMRAAAQLADEVYEHLRDRGLVGRTEREVALEIEAEMRRARGGGHLVPADRRRRRARRAAARRAARRRDPGRHARGHRHGRAPGRLLLGLHAHVRDRHDRRRRRARPTSSCCDAQPSRSRPCAPGRLPRGRRRRARDHRGGRPRRPLRPRPRPRRRARDPRGAAPVQDAPEGELAAGNAVTVEPGVYLPGAVGVRIEDLAIVTDAGTDVLTRFPKELVVAA